MQLVVLLMRDSDSFAVTWDPQRFDREMREERRGSWLH